MDTLTLVCQIVAALILLNVWLLRFGKSTPYRGKEATNMSEEFAAYGLPGWSVAVVGFLKVTSAIALLVGIWMPELVRPAAIVVAVLMVGAITMHVRVGDPVKKALPATLMLALSLIAAA